MGGADAVLARARQDFERGEYRWVAQVCSQLVHAEPANLPARALAADAMEQLGYQAESATWRNAYLQGAMELRHGAPKLQTMNPANADMVRALPLDMFFDYLAMRLDGAKAEGKRLVLNWQFSDTGERYVINLENSALTHVADAQADDADATLVLSRATLDEISLQQLSFPAAVQAGRIQVSGRSQALFELLAMIDRFERLFNVVEPRPPLAPFHG